VGGGRFTLVSDLGFEQRGRWGRPRVFKLPAEVGCCKWSKVFKSPEAGEVGRISVRRCNQRLRGHLIGGLGQRLKVMLVLHTRGSRWRMMNLVAVLQIPVG
jgi:hypothetical protein